MPLHAIGYPTPPLPTTPTTQTRPDPHRQPPPHTSQRNAESPKRTSESSFLSSSSCLTRSVLFFARSSEALILPVFSWPRSIGEHLGQGIRAVSKSIHRLIDDWTGPKREAECGAASPPHAIVIVGPSTAPTRCHIQ